MQVTTSIEAAVAGGLPQSSATGAAKPPAVPRLRTLLEFVAWIVLELRHEPQTQQEQSPQSPSEGDRPPYQTATSELKGL